MIMIELLDWKPIASDLITLFFGEQMEAEAMSILIGLSSAYFSTVRLLKE